MTRQRQETKATQCKQNDASKKNLNIKLFSKALHKNIQWQMLAAGTHL